MYDDSLCAGPANGVEMTYSLWPVDRATHRWLLSVIKAHVRRQSAPHGAAVTGDAKQPSNSSSALWAWRRDDVMGGGW